MIRRLEREGYEAVELGIVLQPRGSFELALRDARGGTLVVSAVDCVDVVAPRKFATIRHAGTYVPPTALADELLNQLPLVLKKRG